MRSSAIGSVMTSIVRGTLCEILRRRTDGIEVMLRRHRPAIDQRPDRATVTLASGAARYVDLVIGADGLTPTSPWSFGEEEQFVRDLGMYLCVFSVPNYLELDRVEVQYSEVGRVASVWSTRDEDHAKACFGFASSQAPSVPIPMRDRDVQQDAVATVYDDVGWEVPRLLELMPGADDWYFDIAAQIEMPVWAAGRVALAGDAAYCASPMSGQGSSLACSVRTSWPASWVPHRMTSTRRSASTTGDATVRRRQPRGRTGIGGLHDDRSRWRRGRAVGRRRRGSHRAGHRAIEAASNAIDLKDYSANFVH